MFSRREQIQRLRMIECAHAGRVIVTSICPRGQNKKQARKLSTQNTGNVYVVAVVDTTRMAILVNSRGDFLLSIMPVSGRNMSTLFNYHRPSIVGKMLGAATHTGILLLSSY